MALKTAHRTYEECPRPQVVAMDLDQSGTQRSRHSRVQATDRISTLRGAGTSNMTAQHAGLAIAPDPAVGVDGARPDAPRFLAVVELGEFGRLLTGGFPKKSRSTALKGSAALRARSPRLRLRLALAKLAFDLALATLGEHAVETAVREHGVTLAVVVVSLATKALAWRNRSTVFAVRSSAKFARLVGPVLIDGHVPNLPARTPRMAGR
jgi:hypothetical protein